MLLGKITIEPIRDDANRMSIYKRRSAGLLKKVQELATLYGVPASIIIYGIGDDSKPMAWPSLPEATDMMKAAMDKPKSSKSKRMLDKESLLRINIAKAEKKLSNLRTQNRQLEINLIMNDIVASCRKDLEDLDPKVIDDLEWTLGKRHEGIRNCIGMLRLGAPQVSPLPQPIPLEASEPLPTLVPQEVFSLDEDNQLRLLFQDDPSLQLM